MPITEDSSVQIKISPSEVLIQQDRGSQYVHFDFALRNTSKRGLKLRRIEVSVYDSGDRILCVRRVDGNGTTRTSIATTGVTELAPEGPAATVFNPFYEFSRDLPVARMDYRFDFCDEEARSYSGSITVRPVVFLPRTVLRLPVRGSHLVDDGNDFYSHHRRLDLNDPLICDGLGIRGNFSRYAYDFVAVDDAGKPFRGTGEEKEDWFGYGEAVFAPADGKVVVAVRSHPEARDPILQALERHDASLLAGNHVIIDHENGEFSLLGHLLGETVSVKPGDRVRAGQVIGKLGLSGSTGHPHLHYELRTGTDFRTAEGLPSYFSEFDRILGDSRTRVRTGTFNTGDFIIRAD